MQDKSTRESRFTVEALYELSKGGYWDTVLIALENDPDFARRAISYVKTRRFCCSSRWTLLHQAAYQGNAQAVDVLIRHGADASLKADYIGTPADVAELCGHYDVAQMLRCHAVSIPKGAFELRIVP